MRGRRRMPFATFKSACAIFASDSFGCQQPLTRCVTYSLDVLIVLHLALQ